MDKKYIQNISGKDFVQYAGLLDDFHKNGGKSIKTKMIGYENGLYIFKAVVDGEKGTFHGYGDAGVDNVNKMIVPHVLRMAETRAKARALRDYCNVDMCSVEELGGEKKSKEKAMYRTATIEAAPVVSDKKCSKCGGDVIERKGISAKTGKPYHSLNCVKCKNVEWIN